VFEADHLIDCEKIRLLFNELFKGADATGINFVGCSGAHTPDLTQLLQELQPGITLQVLQLAHLALSQEFAHLLFYSFPNERDLIHLISAIDRLSIGFDI